VHLHSLCEIFFMSQNELSILGEEVISMTDIFSRGKIKAGV